MQILLRKEKMIIIVDMVVLVFLKYIFFLNEKVCFNEKNLT